MALAGCPAHDTLVTCASELCTNAISHTRSGIDGVFTIEVLRPAAGVARVAVTDAGGASIPVVWGVPSAAGSDLGESGRGLALVSALTNRWGHRELPGGGRVVWAEATWPVPVPA